MKLVDEDASKACETTAELAVELEEIDETSAGVAANDAVELRFGLRAVAISAGGLTEEETNGAIVEGKAVSTLVNAGEIEDGVWTLETTTGLDGVITVVGVGVGEAEASCRLAVERTELDVVKLGTVSGKKSRNCLNRSWSKHCA